MRRYGTKCKQHSDTGEDGMEMGKIAYCEQKIRRSKINGRNMMEKAKQKMVKRDV